MTIRGAIYLRLGTSALAACLVLPAAAHAQARSVAMTIPAQDLGSALKAIAAASGEQVIFRGDVVRGKRSNAVQGSYTAERAIAIAIEGKGLSISRSPRGIILVVASTAVSKVGKGSSTDGEIIAATPEEAEIIVTGSRIRGTTPPGANILTIDRRAIDSSGYATTQQILQSIPQAYGGGANEATSGATGASGANQNAAYGSTINLRGLGPSSTLVLVNGSRPALGGISGTFADISTIPVSAIRRIEVLADGASAIYGSDAVAGVVNILTRRDFTGLETSLRYATADGDFDELQISQIAGAKWASGRAVLALEYNRRGALAASDRDFATQDLRRWGGGDFRSQFANPGTIAAGGQTFAIPAGQDGRSLAGSDLVSGAENRQDGWQNADLLPRQTRYSAYGSVEQAVGDNLTFDVESLYARRNFARRVNPAGYQSSIVVTAANPFYVDPVGTGMPISVRYDFTDDLGPRTDLGHVEAISGTAGARFRRGPWAIDLRGTFGRQSEVFRTINIPNFARVGVAAGRTDPATAFNPFGEGSNSSQAVLDYIRGSTESRGRSTLWSGSLKADGPLFDLPGGPARLALGYEHRGEQFRRNVRSDQYGLEPTFSNAGSDGDRNIEAFFAELVAPVVGEDNDIPGVRSLTLSGAVRREHYNDFGATLDPKFGISWVVIDGLRLRGSFGTSFRAPGFADLVQDDLSNVSFITPLDDPASPTGTSNALFIRGNKLGMKPEKARTFTFGADIEPLVLPGLRIAATYYDIRYKDRIVDLTPVLFQMLRNRASYQALIVDAPPLALLESYINSPGFLDFYGLDASDVDVFIDAQTQNLAVTRQRGIDFDIQYRTALASGMARIGIDGTYILQMKQAASGTAPYVNLLDTINNPVALRMRGLVGWNSDSWSLSAQANYTGHYSNNILAPAERVKSWLTIDAQVGYRFTDRKGALSGLSLSLGATNLFDRDPPYAAFSFNGITAVGYDPQNANPIGRVVSLQLTKSW
ncbi:iron complex outermembrane recepter protein [Sphingopyxis sp. YR583]|uniref:TonB-dependent receptor n=1 Tax=Sphingopyxis sp. YR583 TaxID=1881047 RepID=UPI0008A72E6C|nr:TonB-dependent receptor [Sphingopyxis sp. YR583]SEH19260.1 iron complex outermembrane recepter protein [Sphingopyxis sp. YR583]